MNEDGAYAQVAATQGDEQPLQQGHPNHPKAMRVEAVLVALPLLIGALVAEYLTPFPNFLIAGPVALILLLVVIMLPHRRYAVRGYALSEDRLRVVRGMMFHADTVVPFGRVQHIDVDRGPIERYYGLATLQLYTAGSHGDVISLPGLAHQDALDMRETIRAHIKRASL
ncbi:PH domain-containing protein [Citromicrobium bathyomarinum]|uniref:PH domain-containing protein n=1 Tax=Citromicrobium bathyomarinum TaxID=72174 RepID=UPI001E60B2E2|nr:PH domain-containing protein [Citromicrobium bathyomarinum]MCD1622705.1 PH domain-containing protein [Citromicrobium bathyomarinum]